MTNISFVFYVIVVLSFICCPAGGFNSDSMEMELKYRQKKLNSYLKSKVRVLCWVSTNPANHRTLAHHVKMTWGRRCNKLLFMSSRKDRTLPTIQLPVFEDRDLLWAKTKKAFKYVHEHHRDDADWFMKADDDSFVVLENLRYLLHEYSPAMPIYFGARMKGSTIQQGYMDGGAGYVLSRAALDLLVSEGSNSSRCSQGTDGAEDYEIGKCLERIGVKAMDSRDTSLRGRFFPLHPACHMFPNKDRRSWYWRYKYYPSNEGIFNCCSDHVISFHRIGAKGMYALNYLMYYLKPHGNYQNTQVEYRYVVQEKNVTIRTLEMSEESLLLPRSRPKVTKSIYNWTIIERDAILSDAKAKAESEKLAKVIAQRCSYSINPLEQFYYYGHLL